MVTMKLLKKELLELKNIPMQPFKTGMDKRYWKSKFNAK